MTVVAESKNVVETLKLVKVFTYVVDIIFDIEVDCVIKEPVDSVVTFDDTKVIVTSSVFVV